MRIHEPRTANNIETELVRIENVSWIVEACARARIWIREIKRYRCWVCLVMFCLESSVWLHGTILKYQIQSITSRSLCAAPTALAIHAFLHFTFARCIQQKLSSSSSALPPPGPFYLVSSMLHVQRSHESRIHSNQHNCHKCVINQRNVVCILRFNK